MAYPARTSFVTSFVFCSGRKYYPPFAKTRLMAQTVRLVAEISACSRDESFVKVTAYLFPAGAAFAAVFGIMILQEKIRKNL